MKEEKMIKIKEKLKELEDKAGTVISTYLATKGIIKSMEDAILINFLKDEKNERRKTFN
jgi:hypothetical protein